MQLAASVPQQLYATSGRATLAQVPWLYGAEAAARAARAAAASGANAQGQPQLQNVPAVAAGGSAPASIPGVAPAAVAMTAPVMDSGYSMNDMRNLGEPGRSEGGGYGGGQQFGAGDNPYGQRYTDLAKRGTAPLTLAGLAAALTNAYGLMGPGVVQTGALSMAELAGGQPPGALGGIQDIPGYQGIYSNPRTVTSYMAAQREALARGAQHDPRLPGGGAMDVGAITRGPGRMSQLNAAMHAGFFGGGAGRGGGGNAGGGQGAIGNATGGQGQRAGF